MFFLIMSWTSSRMGYVRSKTTGSPYQIFEKPSRRENFQSHIQETFSAVCLGDIVQKFENGSDKKLGHWIKCEKHVVYAVQIVFSVEYS